MPDSGARSAEIAVEQAQVDRVYARVAEIRAEALTMRERGYDLARGAAREAIFEQATMLHERDVLVQHTNRLLAALDAEHEGLVFGRLDLEPRDGDHELSDANPLYVGRMGIRDAEFRGLVTDWRAPASAAFYQATAQEPMGVLRRRVIRCSGPSVITVEDDLLTAQPLPEHIRVVGEGALLAALGRTRGDTMHDIVATIQREQDEVIRAPSAGVTEIVGGPGTGKTAVALHRVAYLLYAERRRLAGPGVLVIGPSPVFMTYIARVLPSMGEETAQLRALGEVLDGVTATRIDPAPVAAVKGSLRMLRLLRRAVRAAPLNAPTRWRTTYLGEVLTLEPADLVRARRRIHSRGGSANRIRVRAAEELLEVLWRKAEKFADDRFKPRRDELITELGERIEFHRFLVAWWPPLVPAQVLAGLGDRARLAEIARGVLTDEEIDLLSASWRQPGVSVADVALLDELRVLVGEPRRGRRQGPAEPLPGAVHGRSHYDEYAHVVVDESQDLSPMQWRMVGRRGRYASWTVLGDPVQSSWPDPAEAARARDTALSRSGERREFTLRTNYRNSAEIFSLAASVLGDAVPPDALPVAVRSSGVAPVIRQVGDVTDLATATREAAAELLAAVEGTVGVISAMDRIEELRGWLDGLAPDRLRPVGSLESKGMEYDAVVIVEPGEMIAESSTGRRALYVALTRATQQLTVLATKDDWRP